MTISPHTAPSGRLRVIDAEHIGLATEGDALWEHPPAPRRVRSGTVAQRVPQEESSGVSAFFRTWHGDEADEDLPAAPAEIR
jgi:hypothetical protein